MRQCVIRIEIGAFQNGAPQAGVALQRKSDHGQLEIFPRAPSFKAGTEVVFQLARLELGNLSPSIAGTVTQIFRDVDDLTGAIGRDAVIKPGHFVVAKLLVVSQRDPVLRQKQRDHGRIGFQCRADQLHVFRLRGTAFQGQAGQCGVAGHLPGNVSDLLLGQRDVIQMQPDRAGRGAGPLNQLAHFPLVERACAQVELAAGCMHDQPGKGVGGPVPDAEHCQVAHRARLQGQCLRAVLREVLRGRMAREVEIAWKKRLFLHRDLSVQGKHVQRAVAGRALASVWSRRWAIQALTSFGNRSRLTGRSERACFAIGYCWGRKCNSRFSLRRCPICAPKAQY